MLLGVTYLNPLFLWGLGAVSLPIIIHLLFKKRRKKLLFSTLRFLKIATRENARRNRIKQLILLLLRMAVVALVIFAFARPFFRHEALAGIGPGAKEVVFLVDRSFSMGAESELGGTKFERAAAYAADMVSELKTGDKAAVIAFDETPELVQPMTDSFGAVTAALGRLATSARATNFAAAIAAAQEQFDWESPRQKAIFLVSDLQVSGLGELGDVALRRGVGLEIPDLTHPPANVAVTKFAAVGEFLQSEAPLTIAADLRNYSTEPKSVLAEFTVGGAVVAKQRVSLGPAGAATVEFEYTFNEPAVHGVAVTLEADDALKLDNAACAALDVRRALRVLCVNGTPSQIPYFRETHYIQTALNPYRFGHEPGTTMFDPTVISPDALAGLQLKGFDAIVLANVDYLDAGVVSKLEDYVRAGGGLMIFTGDKVSIIQYDRDLYKDGEGLLPAKLDPPTGSLVDASVFWEITNFDEDHYIFQPFLDPAEGDLSVPRFQRIHRLSSLDEANGKALAFLNDGRPILVEKAFGAGRVLLMPTSADVDWNDMPKRKVFLPFLHRAIGYLCGAVELERLDASFTVGEPVPLPDGVAKVLDPQGRVIEPADPKMLRETDEPGLYTVRLDDGTERAIAIVVNPVESDLRSYTVAEFRRILAGDADGAVRAGLGDEDLGDRDEIWQYVFMTLLAFLLVETWLANRTHV
jgi:hypothetical protein